MLLAEDLGVQEEEKGSDCLLTLLCVGIAACRCQADGHTSRSVLLEQAVGPHSEYPCVSSWVEKVFQQEWSPQVFRNGLGGSRGVQAALLGATATGVPWLWTLLSCSFVHGVKCSWGDTELWGCRWVQVCHSKGISQCFVSGHLLHLLP